jgi:hypothetical protein
MALEEFKSNWVLNTISSPAKVKDMRVKREKIKIVILLISEFLYHSS